MKFNIKPSLWKKKLATSVKATWQSKFIQGAVTTGLLHMIILTLFNVKIYIYFPTYIISLFLFDIIFQGARK